MMALLRYIVLKSLRERLLMPLLLMPAILHLAAMLALMTRASWKSEQVYPFTLMGYSQQSVVAVLTLVATISGAVCAAVAAFLAFQTEVKNRSIGLFLLAVRPIRIDASAAVFGTMIGLGSMLPAMALSMAATAAVPEDLFLRAPFTFVFAFLAACGAVLLLSFSPDFGSLIGLPVLIVPIAIAFRFGSTMILATSIAIGVLAVLIASHGLQRRCAT